MFLKNMMKLNEPSGSYWRRASTIRSVWLNILSKAADLAAIAKREQTSKQWNDVTRQNPIYFEMKRASARGSDQIANLYLTHFFIMISLIVTTLLIRDNNLPNQNE